MSCNSCVKNVEYLKLIFISLGRTVERDIFRLTKVGLMNEKIEPKLACYHSPHIEICGTRCNT